MELSCKKSAKTFGPSFHILLAGFLAAGISANAEIPVGIIGGEGTGAYGALVTNLDGSVLPLSPLPSSGVSLINSVGINPTGISLIGGRDDSAAYAAYVSADGTLTSLILSVPTGEISDVAINASGLGLIGGRNIGLGSIYLAHVLPSGSVTPISVSKDLLESVALNDLGVGLVGGEGGSVAFASYVASDGTVTDVSGTTTAASRILAVAINDSGNGVIGGRILGIEAYAALVYAPGGASLVNIGSLPTGGSSEIVTVAINSESRSIIGGRDGSNNAYAALVNSDGAVTDLFTSPFSGVINSVALNDFSIGLIGGENGADIYAAIVQADGSLTPLFDSSVSGDINSVAIDNSGVGLIGGTMDSSGYAALVAPNGALTRLTTTSSVIHSVDSIPTESLFNQIVPASTGSYMGVLYAQMAATAALEKRMIQQNRVWGKGGQSSNAPVAAHRVPLNELQANLAFSPKVESNPRVPSKELKKNSFWVEPFGDLTYLDAEGAIPSLSNQIAGILVGYDRQGENFIVGTTGGYAFNYINYASSFGLAKVDEEILSVYGSYYGNHFWMAAALWGGLYQTTITRHPIHEVTAKGKTQGWILQPHLEFATPKSIDRAKLYYIEPFAQFDWVNSWQDSYTETGSSGLNLQIPSLHNSLLQSEVGLRFYERVLYTRGELCLEQKVSYVNQAPFGDKSVTTSFVSSSATFPVAVASSKVQNLGSLEILGSFVPQNPSYPYGGFSFQATAGSAYQSYFASLFLGKDF